MISTTQFLILTHQKPEQVSRMCDYWSSAIEGGAEMWIAYGGTRDNFERIDWSRKFFVEDARLRTKDHQRERQSYIGVFQAFASQAAGLEWDAVYFTEFDQIPLVRDLRQRLADFADQEQADALFHGLYCLDDSNQPDYLSHLANPKFEEFFCKVGKRQKLGVMKAYGFGQYWKRRAFELMVRWNDASDEVPPVYLEFWGPTLAHMLGFRLRELKDQMPFNHYLEEPAKSLIALKKLGAWCAHPYKTAWDEEGPLVTELNAIKECLRASEYDY